MQKTQLESYKTPIINEQGANLSIKSVYYSWWHLFLSMSDANYIFKLWVVWGYPKDFFPTPSWNLGFSGGFLLKNPQNLSVPLTPKVSPNILTLAVWCLRGPVRWEGAPYLFVWFFVFDWRDCTVKTGSARKLGQSPICHHPRSSAHWGYFRQFLTRLVQNLTPRNDCN